MNVTASAASASRRNSLPTVDAPFKVGGIDAAGAGVLVRRTAAAIMASLAWTACSMAGPNTALRIEQGQAFSLRPGESAQTADGALRIGFDGVTADSRCAKGEQCVRAGEAIARVWFQQGSGQKETRELRTAPDAAQTTRVLDQFIRLVRLDPIAVTGKAIEKAEYVATLKLSRTAANEAER
jgi:hypothetical protein